MVIGGATAPFKDKTLLVSLLGIPLLLLSSFALLQRATMEVDGIITNARTTCVSNNYRCETVYELDSPHGKKILRVPHNDDAIRTDLKVGDHLLKQSWHLDYVLNQQVVSDFPTIFYVCMSMAGIILLALGVLRLPKIVSSYLRS
jgi:hypothetical protein